MPIARREVYLENGRTTIKCPRLMTDEETRQGFAAFVETVRARPPKPSLPVSPPPGTLKHRRYFVNSVAGQKSGREDHRRIKDRPRHYRAQAGVSVGVVALSAPTATTPHDLSLAVQDRLAALARAHALTLTVTSEGSRQTEQSTTLHDLIQTIFWPYEGRTDGDGARVTISGPDIRVARGSLTAFALLLHELATNAAKYGALSTPTGHIDITSSESDGQFSLTWVERGGPHVDEQSHSEGFGTLLARKTVNGQLGGEISRDWKPEGLTIRLSLATDRVTGE